MTADPFGLDDVEELPRRDRWGRPLLIPVGKTEREPYTRASSLSSMLADETSLSIWAQNQIIVGMAHRPDLVAQASTLPPLHDEMRHKSQLSKEEKQQDIATKKALAEIRDLAREQAKVSFKARMGTAVHSACEPGVDDMFLLDSLRIDAAAFKRTLKDAGIEVYSHETFTASDDLMVAGSFDYLASVPNLGPMILDIKTGSVDVNDGLKFAVQLACYANSDVYDVHTDQRAPLESLTAGEEINRKHGLIAHVALGTGTCTLYLVDLDLGLKAAKLATRVREARKLSKEAMSPAALLPGAVFA